MKLRIVACALALLLALGIPALSESEGLWGRRVTAELVDVPDEAFEDDTCQVAGMSADGSRLLITRVARAPYLWDMEAEEKIPVHPATVELAEALLSETDMVLNQAGVDADGVNAFLDRFRSPSGILNPLDMLDALCRATQTRFEVLGSEGGYMRLLNAGMRCGEGLVDVRTGAYYAALDGTGLNLPVKDGAAIATQMPDVVKVTALKTRESSPLELDGLDGASVNLARYLPDGSVCGLLRDNPMDMQNGQLNRLIVQSAERSERWPLGKIRFGREPNALVASKDGRFLLAWSDRALQITRQLFRVDRAQGAVTLIHASQGKVIAEPLENFIDEAGILAEPAWSADEVIVPLTTMADGSILCTSPVDAGLFLLDPETLSAQVLLSGERAREMGILQALQAKPITGNGLDRFAVLSLGNGRQILQLRTE